MGVVTSVDIEGLDTTSGTWELLGDKSGVSWGTRLGGKRNTKTAETSGNWGNGDECGEIGLFEGESSCDDDNMGELRMRL